MENGLVSNVEGAWKLAKARHEIPLFSRTGIDRGHPHARTHIPARARTHANAGSLVGGRGFVRASER